MAKKNKSFSVSLVDIIDREFSAKEPTEKLKENFDQDSLQLGINLNFSPSKKENNLLLNIAIKFEYPYEDEKVELLKAKFSFQFEISNMEKIISLEGEKIDIPDGLAINLVSVSLSTIRGLIASKTQGYFINQFYLPIINPKELVGLFNSDEKET